MAATPEQVVVNIASVEEKASALEKKIERIESKNSNDGRLVQLEQQLAGLQQQLAELRREKNLLLQQQAEWGAATSQNRMSATAVAIKALADGVDIPMKLLLWWQLPAVLTRVSSSTLADNLVLLVGLRWAEAIARAFGLGLSSVASATGTMIAPGYPFSPQQ